MKKIEWSSVMKHEYGTLCYAELDGVPIGNVSTKNGDVWFYAHCRTGDEGKLSTLDDAKDFVERFYYSWLDKQKNEPRSKIEWSLVAVNTYCGKYKGRIIGYVGCLQNNTWIAQSDVESECDQTRRTFEESKSVLEEKFFAHLNKEIE